MGQRGLRALRVGRMNVFFQGSLAARWMSGRQRMETLQSLGANVRPFCQSRWLDQAHPNALRRVLGRPCFKPEVVDSCNEAWLAAVTESRPEVVWCEWPKLIRSETIRAARAVLPDALFVAFYDDNPFGLRTSEDWQWQVFLDAIPDYDLHLVKRASDIAELQARGAAAAEIFVSGYFEPLFFPPALPGGSHYPLVFVGTPLDRRAEFLSKVVDAALPLHVFGNRWEREPLRRSNKALFHSAVLEKDYADVLRGARISLGLVSSSNLDEYSMRTFEIPACGSFLLAQRTRTHSELFAEGREAEFFDDANECIEKARFYLGRENLRREIAAGGLRRCVESGYGLRSRMQDALNKIENLRETPVYF